MFSTQFILLLLQKKKKKDIELKMTNLIAKPTLDSEITLLFTLYCSYVSTLFPLLPFANTL